MSRDPRYDILFEPVKIGPVTTKNRFYQVPHCNGMGYRDATALATMRALKAEGGWGVVCTEQVEIHPTGDIAPFVELRIWDDQDIPMLARIAEAVKAKGALAGLQLAHNSMNAPNLYSREIPLGPADLPVYSYFSDPVQVRAMDKTDIRNFRKWHRDAALRAKRAGFDIIYVYAGKFFGLPQYFLSRRFNQRTDEYGGSLENRARLLRELIEETKDAVGDTCAVPCRISVDELIGEEGIHAAEIRDVIGMMADLPDLWDLALSGWENDSQTSRFSEEGFQVPYIRGIKQLTTKPVVSVGRYTSPDLMVKLIREGVIDLVGAARPSIADPYLPKKIEDGRIEDIRECIGCNMCVAGDFTMSPARCTQNPSFGDEWRRGWHPETIRTRKKEAKVLVVGSGPAGLEAAMMLGRRGYEVALAEAGDEPGGRVIREAKLPGLSAWKRVTDYRHGPDPAYAQRHALRGSALTADDIMSFGFAHVAIATGSAWRKDGVARRLLRPAPVDGADVLSPDDIMNGKRPKHRNVVVYDDDHYYMGGVLAELLAKEDFTVTVVTPAAEVSTWMRMTMEQLFVQHRLVTLGVKFITHHGYLKADGEKVSLACIFTGRETVIEGCSTVMVTARLPHNSLARALEDKRESWADSGITSVTLVGDALAPGTIAAAVWSGRRYAEEFDEDQGPIAATMRREVTGLSAGPFYWETA